MSFDFIGCRDYTRCGKETFAQTNRIVGVAFNSTFGYNAPGNQIMTLGEYIKQLRQAKKLTQRRLAELAGVDFTYLSKIENDRLEHSPSLKTLKSLADTLEIDELELLNLADKMPPVLREIADNPEALQFFRRASKVSRSPTFWRSLTSQLDQVEWEIHRTKADPDTDERENDPES